MDERDYDSGRTVGGKWGCALSAIVGVPLLVLLWIPYAFSHCDPDVGCHEASLFLTVIVPGALVAALVGFLSRAIINDFMRRRKDD
jgi:hypothetical protein